jgi:hypothetical protein
VDSLRVGFELDSSSLGLPYNEGAPHIVTYDDLTATGVQGEPAACAGDQDGRCCGIMGRNTHSPADVGVERRTALPNLGVVIVL